MVRRRSLRRRSIKKSLRSRRRDRACNSYDLRSRRRNRACTSYDLRSRRLRTLFGRKRSLRASYRFGAEQKEESLISAFVEIVKKDPKAAASILHLGVTTFLNECGIKEPGAIENEECAGNNVQATRELREFLDNWNPAKGPGPVPKSVPKSVKFGVYPLDMSAIISEAMRELAKLEKRQEKADKEHEEQKQNYEEKKRKIIQNLKVLKV